jgi:K+-transporting ATPase, c chain
MPCTWSEEATMNTYVRPAMSLILLMTVVTGALYPLAVTGVAQLAFPEQANGSLVRDERGQVRGSALIAQDFQGDGWFHSRPSAGAFATVASSASNLAPSNPALAERVKGDAAVLYQAQLGPVPQALLTTSAAASTRTCHRKQWPTRFLGWQRRGRYRWSACKPCWKRPPSTH